jgi:hypothetical protein
MNEAAYHAILRRLGVESPTTTPSPVLVARLVAMPLLRFEREGCPLEVRVSWLSVTLWFAPTETDAEALSQEGISRGRIWTARELGDLLSIPTLTTEQAQTIAQAKVEFGGQVIKVRARREPR